MDLFSFQPRNVIIGILLLVSGALFWWYQTSTPTNEADFGRVMVQVQLPEKLSPLAKRGEGLFHQNCASCHGMNGAGQDGVAPPLIHKIYEPSHHSDVSFQRAMTLGVRAHHWPFGDMPPVVGISQADIAPIIAYIRAVQRKNGID